MSAAVLAGAKICDVADHGYGSIYGQAPALTLIQTLEDYGKKAVGVDIRRADQISDLLRRERKIYEPFESPFRGHDPTVAHYKLTGGAVGSAFEQADKGGFLDRMPEILGNGPGAGGTGELVVRDPGLPDPLDHRGQQRPLRPLRAAVPGPEEPPPGPLRAAAVL